MLKFLTILTLAIGAVLAASAPATVTAAKSVPVTIEGMTPWANPAAPTGLDLARQRLDPAARGLQMACGNKNAPCKNDKECCIGACHNSRCDSGG